MQTPGDSDQVEHLTSHGKLLHCNDDNVGNNDNEIDNGQLRDSNLDEGPALTGFEETVKAIESAVTEGFKYSLLFHHPELPQVETNPEISEANHHQPIISPPEDNFCPHKTTWEAENWGEEQTLTIESRVRITNIPFLKIEFQNQTKIVGANENQSRLYEPAFTHQSNQSDASLNDTPVWPSCQIEDSTGFEPCTNGIRRFSKNHQENSSYCETNYSLVGEIRFYEKFFNYRFGQGQQVDASFQGDGHWNQQDSYQSMRETIRCHNFQKQSPLPYNNDFNKSLQWRLWSSPHNCSSLVFPGSSLHDQGANDLYDYSISTKDSGACYFQDENPYKNLPSCMYAEKNSNNSNKTTQNDQVMCCCYQY